LKSLNRI